MGRGGGRGRYETRVWDVVFARAGGRRAGAGSYEAFIPDQIGDLDLSLDSGTVTLSERAGTAVRELNASATGHQPLEGLARQLLRSEALASSAIEGLRISHRKLALAEIQGEEGPHKAREVLANMKAMERAIQIGEKSGNLKVKDVTAIHRELAVVPPLDKIAGQLRDGQGWIGGDSPPDAGYVGPPEKYVKGLVEDLCEFMNRDDISPVTQAAVAHAQFELVHPFRDGNGRVGRCLIHVLFKRRGVAPSYVPPVSLVLGANKDAYIAGLENFREDKVDRWVSQFSKAVEIAASRAEEFSGRVSDLQDEWRAKAQPRANSAASLIIDFLPSFPSISANVAIEVTGRSRPAVLGGLNQLAEAGVLTKHSNKKTGDTWEAKELFGLLDQFEAAVKMPS